MLVSQTKAKIYLDHAATSYPKAPGVIDALTRYMSEIGASAGRGAYAEALMAKEILEECRTNLSQLFQTKNPSRFIFTLNATEALNLAMKGIVKEGGHVLTSCLEHNSISRPLTMLASRNFITFDCCEVNKEGELLASELEKKVKPNTQLLAFIHGSNVSGTRLQLELLKEFSKQKGIPLLLDASQTAGAYPFSLDLEGVDLLAMPGHKGLLGPLGTGVLWVKEGLELQTLKEGGTGSFSEGDEQPLVWPDRHESGSHNLPGIVGLNEALKYLLKVDVENIAKKKEQLLSFILPEIQKLENPNMRLIAASAKNNAGVFSLVLQTQNIEAFAFKLDEEYGIKSRPGLHCAPWAHARFSSLKTGALRFSVGYSNTLEEMEFLLKALKS